MTRQDQMLALSRHLIDPRGRADRRAMFASAVGLLLVQAVLAGLFAAVGADLTGNTFIALNIALFWIGGVVLVKRLHDIGWSGWWIVPAIAFWIVGFVVLILALGFVVGFARFEANLAAYPLMHGLLVLVGMIPPFGGLLWLQACPGTAGVNRFGPVPGPLGFATGPQTEPIEDVGSAVTA